MNRLSSVAWIAAFAAGTLISCSSYDGFELRKQTEPPVPVTVDASSVILPQGAAVGVRVVAPGAEDPETGELFVSIRSSDPSVIQVWPTLQQSTFVIHGVSEGTAVLTVMFEDEDDESIPAKVTASGGGSAGTAGAAGTGAR